MKKIILNKSPILEINIKNRPSGVARVMCMGGTTYIWGAQINCIKMVLAEEAIYNIYIHRRTEGDQRGLAPPLKSIKV